MSVCRRRIRGRDVLRLQPQLAADHVAALGERRGLVERDLAVAALPPEAAVAGNHQPLRRNVLQGISDGGGHVLRAVRLQVAVADGPDGDLFLAVLEALEESMSLKLRSFISTVQTSPLASCR